MITRQIGVVFVAGTLLACAGAFSITRTVKHHLTEGGPFAAANAISQSAADGQALRRAIQTYKARHGTYPKTLVLVIQDGLVDGKILHAPLDNSPNPLHVSWLYAPPPDNAPPSFALLTLPYQLGSAAQAMTITLSGDVKSGNL